MTQIQRREFLELVGSGTALSLLPGARASLAQGRRAPAGAARPVLVCLYLRGGLDALNAVVPYGDERYYALRPTIAIPPEDDPQDGPGVVRLDSTFGLHPSLRPLKPLWDAGRLAAVLNCGSPHPTRSHFDAQDFMEYAAPGLRTVQDGWLNRYLEASRGRAEEPREEGELALRAIAMQGLLPRALRGRFPALAVPDRRVLNDRRMLETFEDLYGSMEDMEERAPQDPVLDVGRETLETLAIYRETLQRAQREGGPEYPPGPYGHRLRDIATIVRADAGLEVACLDVLGWDHHAGQGGNEGLFTDMLATLGGSLAAFVEDLGEHLERTLVLVVTEFGRTCRENGNTGTDHGRGGLMLLLGGAVQGGKLHGKWDGLEDRDLVEGRDLQVTTDFRDVFADVLRNHLGFDPPRDFFPGYAAKSVKGLF